MKSFLRVNTDRGVAVLLVVVGVVILIIGWVEMSGSALAAQQLPYLLSAGLGGIAFIGVGCTTWISADLQDEWRELDAIEVRLAEVASRLGVDEPLDRDTESTASDPLTFSRVRRPSRRAAEKTRA